MSDQPRRDLIGMGGAQSIGARLCAVAAEHPSELAVLDDGVRLTYAELLARARRVAAAVAAETVIGQRVGVLCPFGADTVVAALGVWLAGRVVLVLDPQRPSMAHARVLQHCGVEAVVCTAAHRDAASALPVSIRVTVSPSEAGTADSVEPAPLPEPSPDAIAYLLTTSGSTGAPKGVLHTHGNGLVHATASTTGRNLVVGSRMGLVARLAAGAGLSDMLTALLHGATLCPFDLHAQGVAELLPWLARRRIEVLRTVPTVFRQLAARMEHSPQPVPLDGLRLLGLGGEAVLPSDVATFARVFPAGCRLLVGFGSTETHRIMETVVDEHTQIQPRVPVGRPLHTARVELLDDDGQVLGPGPAVGVLRVTGRFIGHGYAEDPEGTAQRFGPADAQGWRTFSSGDRMERRADGQYAFVDRERERVMIAGNTVQLAEVEAAVNAEPEVVAAAVLAVPSRGDETVPGGEPIGDQMRLVAFVQPVGPQVTAAGLRRALAEHLPLHKVPGRIRICAALPRLPSGKVDRQQLRGSARAQDSSLAAEVAEPSDPTERALLKIWRESLGQPRLGVHDDFFEHGGQSLSAVELLTRVEQIYGVRYTAAQLLREPTVAGFARMVGARSHSDELSLIAPLRPAGRGAPLFCLPGIGGSPVGFRAVADLVDDAAVYGVDFNPLLSIEPRPSMDELARRVVELVAPRAGRGPVRVLGYSLGGLLAFEVARTLMARGIEVERLVILDMVRPGTPLSWRKRDRLRFHLDRLLTTPPHTLIKLLAERVWQRARGIKPSDLIDEESVDHHPLLAERYDIAQAAHGYEPGYFAGPMCLLLCDEPADGYKRKPTDGGWTGHVRSVTTRRVAMDHHELLKPHRFAEIADPLRALLQDPIAGGGRPQSSGAKRS